MSENNAEFENRSMDKRVDDHTSWPCTAGPDECNKGRGTTWEAGKFLVRPGRKQATVTEDFDFHISYL